MTPEEAVQLAIRQFPFQGYMTPDKGAYLNIANTVLRYLQPGSTILDFGCGPCDKTSILQFLGFRCSGHDDLQDDWHKKPGNREKILSFASECGIDFRLANDGVLPFKKESFDMIMLHDVLEHLHDSPRDLLNDLLELAKPEGLLFVTVPNAVNIRKRIDVLFGRTNLPRFEGYYWYPGSWRGHIREYVRDDLVRLQEYLNLEMIELRGCDHMLKKLPAAASSAYLLLTRMFTGWKDSWLLVARKKQDWVPRNTLSQDELARILGKSTRYKYSE
jgi:SAM-dependent methyltransferase